MRWLFWLLLVASSAALQADDKGAAQVGSQGPHGPDLQGTGEPVPRLRTDSEQTVTLKGKAVHCPTPDNEADYAHQLVGESRV